MSVDVSIVGDVGVVKTEIEFVVIMKDKIHGPFKNEHILKIIEVLEQNKGGNING